MRTATMTSPSITPRARRRSTSESERMSSLQGGGVLREAVFRVLRRSTRREHRNLSEIVDANPSNRYDRGRTIDRDASPAGTETSGHGTHRQGFEGFRDVD